ncbi:DUF3823 domain-containing protein [Dyadobacter luticola]|uniref:DUF3823 domain-containing protein n=1 Tax=Dyadobacter luticola TaxID=1979387 RepID=A0A5R9KXJ3_9BACT|nr:DUF3823 domain-containing protein [Dyadobacter luticola]TLV00860.1 DUF3823 domain-containing protein [Dyadobacter luticola]
MKRYIILFLGLATVFSSCEKDNYTAPKSELSGQIVYKGEPIGVEYNQVRLQLWQPGFGKLAPIDAPVDQDGSYSAVLSNGNYKMVFPKGRGPFKTLEKDAAAKDTLFVKLEGSQQLDVEVMPYYMIRTPQFSGAENKVSVTLKLEKIITDASAKDIERVSLYINKTQFVSRATNVGVTDLARADIKDLNTISVSTTVPALVPAQKYVFATVGVKIKDVEDMIFSPVKKVDL